MFKKILPLIALAFILISTPALASQNKNHTESTVSACSKDDEWENHGAYVSCVARLKLGGKVTSQAAHSDIEKKDDDRNDDEDEDEDEDEEDSSPTSTPTPSPTVSPSVTPSPTTNPSATPSASPAATNEEVIQENINLIEQLIETLKDMVKNLENLLS